ncbi:dual 3',5'-cyclic-AMP and -GMP phosphodiesterase 11 isoform X4 [Diorhabda carinulata]|uniref:dual 3',5'-cyclic-AMP and -GMP phosphodiesterase 11 isoform X4 n=1 Tax=Diorhabda carinulata TaxID=1163345 RepID=UPI0025A2DD5D|nr:dual 3',5'-cyclic-AMP and -GMP phosphodiesterase 11 isoform X4 [Diorhabda carinulata]
MDFDNKKLSIPPPLIIIEPETMSKLALPLGKASPPVQWGPRRIVGLQLRNSGEDTRMPIDGTTTGSDSANRLPKHNHGNYGHSYDPEYAHMESWLDEHPDFVNDYFLRKATRQIVEQWQVSHATPTSSSVELSSPSHNNQSRASSGATTPVRKISAHEFERSGLLKPMINTIDGQPTFLTSENQTPAATGSPTLGRRQRRSRHELRQMDEKDLIFELVKDICNELEIRSLCHKILQNVCMLLNADRGSLFLVEGDKYSGCPVAPGHYRDRCLVSKLFDVCSKSTLVEIEKKEEIKIPLGTGIVGYVAESGEPVNIPDAYQDERFNHEVDSRTGYRTKSLLCMPIKDTNGDVIGVAQVINKVGDQPFTKTDEEIFSKYLQFCGIGLRNAHLYEKSQLEIKRNQVLLDLARMIFQEQSTLEHVVYRILLHAQSLIQCQRVQILLTHQDSCASFSRVFDFEENDVNIIESGESRNSPLEGRFPINLGITGHVATTGETVNLTNVYDDSRFDPEADQGTNFKHKTVLCMPIKNSKNKIIGVIQLINKFNDLPFTQNDENFVEAFAIFCGMGIHNTRMYEEATTAVAKQKVILDVLSYHATASVEEAQRLRCNKYFFDDADHVRKLSVVSRNDLRVPSNVKFGLLDFAFDDIRLSDDDTLTACLRMFLDLSLVETFHIDFDVLCRWLLSVKKNYRDVTYHNWRHAFNVGQMMYSILHATRWWEYLGSIECLALMIACLCHDLDHRGTNNSFQMKIHSPIAQLYSTSTMEHHHFDQCLMILNSLQLLSNLTPEQHSRVIRVLEEAILATDLAIYFKKRVDFFKIASEGLNWKREEHKESVRGMLMTVCDLAAITKPWEVEKRIAELVSAEFFEQGDLERETLNVTPMDIMDRTKAEKLPIMQINFIDSICLPIYEAFADLSENLQPLLDGVKQNRDHWLEEAQRAHLVPDQEETEEKDDNDNVSKPSSPDQKQSPCENNCQEITNR